MSATNSGVYTVVSSRPGLVVLTDGSRLVLRVVIVGARYVGFSPFGGANFAVKTAGGVASLHVPEELVEAVRNKPLAPPDKPPQEGWELVDIESQEPAWEEIELPVGDKRYRIRVSGEAAMVSRNTSYRTDMGEPLYLVFWSTKIMWKPVG
ncbi:hypothetical protein [Pyrofollis japonicus]|uniref:hypothetical protein n=1 Tax=Pyrofollis japonicus TaxID=3060460 RepID=UPI00295B7CC2|nr:hypothetical protein [Pyrofollis japonicus]